LEIEESEGNRVIATAGMMIATLTNTLDMTIVNVALPHIQGSVSASHDQLTWVLTSYIIANAVVIPLSGWLANKFGRKRLFLVSTALFMFSSMLCAMAWTLPQMVAFRILQGLSGASMMPMSQAAILDLWPQRYIPHVMAIWSGVVTAAPAIGPTLGGYLTDTLSWRWAFYINVPLDILGFVLVYVAMPRDKPGQKRRFDVVGFTALVMFMVSLQLMMDRGPRLDWFDSWEIRLEATLAALGFYLFIVQMVTYAEPHFPRAIFRDRNYVTAQVSTLVLASALYTSSALVPIMMQTLLGYSAIQSGIATIPRGVGSVIAFFIVPWVAQVFGSRRTIAVGVLINIYSLWMMGHFDLSMTSRLIEISGFLQGFGSALMFNPISVIAYSTLRGDLRNEAAVMTNMLRNVGGSLGIAAYTALQLTNSATVRGGMVAHIDASNAVLDWRMPDLFGNLGALVALDGEVNRQAAMIAYNNAFGYMCISSILMVPILLLLRPARTTETGRPAELEPL